MVEKEDTPLAFDQEGNPTEVLSVPHERTLYGVAIWKRILILLAGTAFNLLLAYVVYIAVFQINGFINEYPKPYIESVKIDSPAYEAGLQAGDLITRIEFKNGEVVVPETFYDVIIANQTNTETMTVYIDRNGQSMVFNVDDKETHKDENNRNNKALSVTRRVIDKLTGKDFGPEELSVEEQVDRLIQQATSIENIAQAYQGWCPYW